MGIHSFETDPMHCIAYRSAGLADLPTLHGAHERWNMPAARHRRDFRGDVAFSGVDHYVVSHQFSRTDVYRTDGKRDWPAAGAGATSLQVPGSATRISGRGLVDYAHLYFRQSLLCEVADEAGFDADAEPGDFFGLRDPAIARDIATYLDRAADRDEPATALEMDGRAYLIALGILRLVRRRSASDLLLHAATTRTALRPAFEMIEDRLADPIRLSDLARAVGMSPFHFARVFKAVTGEPPVAYVARKRVECAILAIRSSTTPLAEIAFQAGFSSQSHMTRRVKAATGLTPGQLRRQGS